MHSEGFILLGGCKTLIARRIRARAFRRMGEISRELEKAHKVGQGTKVQIPRTGKLKATILAEAGISTSQAHRAACASVRSSSCPGVRFPRILAW